MANEPNHTFPSDLGDSARLQFKAYSWKMPKCNVNNSEMDRKGSGFECTIYAPANIQDVLSANWGPEKILDAVYDLGKTGYPTLGGLAKQGWRFIAENAGAELTASTSAKQGSVMQPNEIMIFQGMQNVDFNCSFEMTPKSSGEGKTMMAILQGFKNGIRNKGASTFGAMTKLNYPDTFDITCTAGNTKLFAYRNMALTNVQITYGGGASTILHYIDGIPVQSNLTLAFKSIEQAFKDEST